MGYLAPPSDQNSKTHKEWTREVTSLNTSNLLQSGSTKWNNDQLNLLIYIFDMIKHVLCFVTVYPKSVIICSLVTRRLLFFGKEWERQVLHSSHLSECFGVSVPLCTQLSTSMNLLRETAIPGRDSHSSIPSHFSCQTSKKRKIIFTQQTSNGVKLSGVGQTFSPPRWVSYRATSDKFYELHVTCWERELSVRVLSSLWVTPNERERNKTGLCL